MELGDFLTRVIEQGLESIQKDEQLLRHPKRMDGARRGFEACRDKEPSGLFLLLQEARKTRRDLSYSFKQKDYEAARYYELQVEWVCNVVSAALMNVGEPTIVPPTARGLIAASKILGVKGACPS